MAHQKVYFPNLNGLRFIAASLVIVHHIEQLKSIFKLESYWDSVPFIEIIGKLGVVLFFVLSGFLITYLLLVEETNFHKISIRKFYMRRILRIWPLYYLIIFLAFLILPNIGIFTQPGFGKDVVYAYLPFKLVLYGLIFPNLAMSALGIVPYASHTWSIGTEEQYYLVWPVILKYVRKYRAGLMLSIILAYFLVNLLLSAYFPDIRPLRRAILSFWGTFRIDCMAIGGLFAIVLFQRSRLLYLLHNKYVFYGSMVLVSALMINGTHIPHIHFQFYSVFFGIIILNFATNDQIGISLENKFLSYLGNISYGIYMYHPMGIVLAISLGVGISMTSNWMIYPLSFLFTVILASLSFKHFETYFLQFKHSFTKVKSGR